MIPTMNQDRIAKVRPFLELLARWILGGIFVYAGVQKIIDPSGFAKTIYGYGILTQGINLTAILLPWVEVVAGAALVAGIYPASSSGLISGLLILFVAIIVYNIARGYTFDCGCFGAGDDPTGWGTVVRDAGMLALGAIVFLYKGKRLFCMHTGGE